MAEAIKKFRARAFGVGPKGHWTCMKVPFPVEKEFGAKGRVAVQGTLNGFRFRTSIFPDGKGAHFMLVNKQMQAGAGVKAGDTMKVTMAPDSGSRAVALPAALKKALAGSARAKAVFRKLTYSQRQDYATWVGEAKQAETRQRRAEKAVGLMQRGITWQAWRDGKG